jgi:hypothetical protein
MSDKEKMICKTKNCTYWGKRCGHGKVHEKNEICNKQCADCVSVREDEDVLLGASNK